jgi:hypothetical protein
MALARTHEAFVRDHHRHRLVDHLGLDGGALGGLDQRAASIAELLAILIELLAGLLAQRRL